MNAARVIDAQPGSELGRKMPGSGLHGAQRPRVGRGDPRRAQQGFSVIELVVAVAIGLVLTLAVSTVLVRGEGRNRASLAVSDIDQGAAYVSHMLDSAVRSAGSGFSSRWAETYGCRLNAQRGVAALLPRTAAWPAPFAGFTQSPRVAPVIIGKGQSAAGSDVLAVMAGQAGVGESGLEVLALGPPMGLRNTIGLRSNDLLLLADGANDCLLLQATGLAEPAAGTPAVNAGVFDVELLGGTGLYHTTAGTHRNLGDFAPPTPNTVVVNLGSGVATGTTPRNAPRFHLYGVGANNTLFALDMLAVDGGAPQPMVDGVVELRALYGLDTNGDNVLDQWADPGVAPFNAASLLAGTPAAQANLNQIIALRIGVILRTARAEREAVSPSSLTLFADLDTSLHHTRNLSADEQRFRYRSAEVTVPLRNLLLARAP